MWGAVLRWVIRGPAPTGDARMSLEVALESLGKLFKPKTLLLQLSDRYLCWQRDMEPAHHFPPFTCVLQKVMGKLN